MSSRHRLRVVVVAAFLLAWFYGQAWKGLFVFFQADDMMNLYHAWVTPWYKIALANLVPFTPAYRPAGTAFYRILYAFAGLNPLPYRIVVYALLTLNIGLIYRLARLLTNSTEIAVLAALLGAYHNRLMDLYLSGGDIYDILCFTFYCLALSSYVASRQKHGRVTGLDLIRFCILFILALNSKEMAVTLPAVLLAYEWIYFRPATRSLPPWLLRQQAIWVTGILTALAIFAKTRPGGPFAGNPQYIPHFSLHQFLSVVRPNTAELLFLQTGRVNTAETILLFVAVWVIALISRKKHLLLAAVLVTIAPLPIDFIVYRGFFVMYLPYLGWVIYVASLLVETREWLWKTVWKRPSLPVGSWQPERIALFLGVAYAFFAIQSADAVYRNFDQIDPSQARNRDLQQTLVDLHPTLTKERGVLFLDDPYSSEFFYDPIYVVHLLYRNKEIPVDRVKLLPPDTQPNDLNRYGLVLNYCNNRYVVSTLRQCPN